MIDLSRRRRKGFDKKYADHKRVLLFLFGLSFSSISCFPDHNVGANNHACSVCRTCEKCSIDKNGGATCSAERRAFKQCGSDGNVHWFDSCLEQVEIFSSCPEKNAFCENISESDAVCRCDGRWQGDDCSQCIGNWDPENDCKSCKDGWKDENNDCGTCPGNWDLEKDCAICEGYWDPDQDCKKCLNNWNIATSCQSCLGNWDIEQSCLGCIGNWDPEKNCDVCKNMWKNESNNCNKCPGNWDPLSDCSTCRNQWVDNNDDCGTCPGNWDSENDCSQCRGNWDMSQSCEQCEPHWADNGDDCGTCAPGWTGPYCNTCLRMVSLNNTASIKDGLTWETAFSSVQEAINAAVTSGNDKCEVWVAKGRYFVFEQNQLDTISLEPGVELYGGFEGVEKIRNSRDFSANETILDGHSKTNTAYQVNHVVTGNDNAIIDGFVITGGNAFGMSGNDGKGGGMLIDNVSPVVRNCLFRNNKAKDEGGAIFIDTSKIVVEKCRFEENNAERGGAIHTDGNSLTISDCVFENNTAAYQGGAISSGSSGDYVTQKLTVENSVFENNQAEYGGAIESADSTSVTRSVFSSNSASLSGGAIDAQYLGITRSLFENNSAIRGGAIYASNPTIINSTIAGNTATIGAGVASYSKNTSTKIYNTILWDNSGFDVDTKYSTLLEFTYSVTSDTSITGVGIINEDPKFREEPGAYYHLSAGSPCIDAADGEVAVTPDIEGLPIVDDPDTVDKGYGDPRFVDIGAYEYQPENL